MRGSRRLDRERKLKPEDAKRIKARRAA